MNNGMKLLLGINGDIELGTDNGIQLIAEDGMELGADGMELNIIDAVKTEMFLDISDVIKLKLDDGMKLFLDIKDGIKLGADNGMKLLLRINGIVEFINVCINTNQKVAKTQASTIA